MYFPGVERFDAVHVLTTSSERVEPGLQALAAYLGGQTLAEYSISRVENFAELESEEDHQRFEEVLFRWLLARAPDPAQRWVCLAGGYKTISAAMQRAASLFGAAEVFHVLCVPCFGPDGRREASTPEEVEQAAQRGALRFVRLGREPGWPQLTRLTAASFPLTEVRRTPPVVLVSAEGSQLSDMVRYTLDTSRRIASSWDRLADLPFPSLATWPPSHLEWLQHPVDPVADESWVRSLPKVELHCHLGGFATRGELLARVRGAAEVPARLPPLWEPTYPPHWPLPGKPIGLNAYMRLGDATGSALLKDPGCLREQCRLLYQALLADHVVYAEIRCSPANYQDPAAGRSSWDVLVDIREAFQQAMDEAPSSQRCHVNLLLVATRVERGDRSRIARHLALAITAAEHWREGCRVVGVDLAGFEHRSTRADLFATDFEPAHRVGLAVTVHAGENDDVEGIWQAVFRLAARRLGHALRLAAAPDLLRAVAERGIGVEMCPYANYQIKGFALDGGAGQSYPLAEYLRQGVLVSVNTDNLGISAATLSENLLLAARLCRGLRRLDLVRLQANAARMAFLRPAERGWVEGRLAALPSP